MRDELQLSLRNSLSEINTLVSALSRFAAAYDIPPALLNAANLALEEIVVNVISYGYDDNAEHTIEVRVRKRPGELEMIVEDDGRPFNPLTAPEPKKASAVEEMPIGGLGIHLVRRLMDHVFYRREGDRNVLTMTKRC